MYKINKVNKTKTYKRDFEGMGEGLVLLKIESVIKSIGYNYHLFYRNGKKPPLDVAVKPNDLLIEYVSFFLQDESVKIGQQLLEIEFQEDSLSFSFDNLSVDNTSLNFQNDFDVFLLENDLIVLEKGFGKKIYAYLLSRDNYILIDKGDNIIGLCFKNISVQELETLKEAKVI
jgi:hypothetical protein